MSDAQIGFGIVGMGQRGRRGWIKTVQAVKQARLVAVCDPIAPLREEGARLANLPTTQAYSDLDDLLAQPDVDAIAVVVEPEHQAEIAIRALRAGKHVISEVPAAFTLEECWQLIQAVEETERTYVLAEQNSYAPYVRAWRQLYQTGQLGKVVYGEAQYLHGMTDDRYWHDGETGRRLTWEEARAHPHARKSRVWNLRHPIWYNPHSLAPLLRVLDDRVVTITCMSTRRPSYVREELPNSDFEVALMHTANDTILRIACGFVAPTAWPYHWHHLLGTRGEVETARQAAPDDGLYGQSGLMWLADRFQRGRQPTAWEFTPYQAGASGAGATGHAGSDFYPAQDFVECVLENRRPIIDVYRACEIAGPAIVAGHSAEQGGIPLAVPDFRPNTKRPVGQYGLATTPTQS
jgi:predicted dehydrogenase